MTLPSSRILIVDDVEPNRILLADSMFALGHDPHTAENGLKALDLLRKQPFDLVLLDILMPELDGYETLQRIRADEKLRHIPVIVISAVDELDTVVRCVSAGADDYLIKPFNATLLKARIHASLDRKHLHDKEEAHRLELEAANERITQQNAELTESNALKDKFLQIATHDIRNPLTTINACVFSLRKAAARGNFERIDETLDMIERATGRMGGLVSDFLDFREIRSGNCKIDPQHCNLNELICNLVDENREYAEGKRIALQFTPDNSLPECHIDWNRTSQIASNFISNALKFTPHGGSVNVRTVARSGRIRTEIQDSGPGIPPGERNLLFREFARLSPRPTGDEKSSGLGLSIVKHLAEMQGGTVGADFPTTGGSIFWFELPAGT